MSYLLGIDGGQSETRCVVGRRDGTIVANGTGSAVDHVLVPGGEARVTLALTSASRAAVQSLAPEPVETVFLALSGVVPPGPEADAVFRIAREVWPHASIHLSHDLRAAWAGAFALSPGIVVVAGSGSAAFGVSPDGREARAGGWGYLLGDEGAGWWIGREAIAAALRAQDGTGPATRLTARLPAHYGVSGVGEIAKGVYAERLNRTAVAGASRLVLEAAAEGDVVSQSLVQRAVDALTVLVDAVSRNLDWHRTVRVATAGGLWQAAVLREAFAHALKTASEDFILMAPTFPPSVGAFLLALHAAGAPVHLEALSTSWKALGQPHA